jgi:hypothetical protein
VSGIVFDPRNVNSGGAGIGGTNGDSIVPMDRNSVSDADIDLGFSNLRWRDLYIAGGIHLGGTGSANKLDDYEEGTWTVGATANGNITSMTDSAANYTKIGRLVTLSFSIVGTIASASAETSFRFNLPFLTTNNTNQNAGGTASFFIGGGSDRFGLGNVHNGTTSYTTSHIYIPASEMNSTGSITLRVSMSYIAA